MPVLIGLLFGRMFMQVAFSRVVLALVLWAGVYGLGEDLGEQFVHRDAGRASGLLACGLLLGWALRRPARSRARLWVLDGVYLWLRLGIIAAIAMTLVALHDSRGRPMRWLEIGWPFALAGILAWAAQRWLTHLLVRSHRRESEASAPG